MNINIVRSSGEPISRQIAQQIADRIESGLIDKGSRLPSVRSLSSLLNVSPVTVLKAYSILDSLNITCTRHGKGTFVNRTNSDSISYCDDHAIYDWQQQIPDYISRAQFWNCNTSWGPDSMLHLSNAHLHHSFLPLANISEKLIYSILGDPTTLYDYGPIQGDVELRDTIASYLMNKNINVTAENILITNGSQQGIDLIANTFIGSGDLVVMESPTYTAAIDSFRKRGATIITVPMDSNGMRTNQLLKLCDSNAPKLIYTMPTYQNPTGVTLSCARRNELLDIAKAYNSIIVEDDLWSELSYEDAPPYAIKSQDDDGHVIYLKGFSKFLFSGCRIGVIAASGSILNRLIACKAASDLGSPLLTQRFLLPFVKHDFIYSYLTKLNGSLTARRNLALELLKEYMPANVKWSTPKGGSNLWITLPQNMDANDILNKAVNRNITFLPGSACYPYNVEHNHFRISFSYLKEDDLKIAIIELCKLVSSEIKTPKASYNNA